MQTSFGKHNITAIITDRKGRVLSIGKNSYVKTHPVQAKAAAAVGLQEKIFLHAEVAALVKLKDWNRAHKITVMRYHRAGTPAPARPCKVCLHMIEQAGIKHVEHT